MRRRLQKVSRVCLLLEGLLRKRHFHQRLSLPIHKRSRRTLSIFTTTTCCRCTYASSLICFLLSCSSTSSMTFSILSLPNHIYLFVCLLSNRPPFSFFFVVLFTLFYLFGFSFSLFEISSFSFCQRTPTHTSASLLYFFFTVFFFSFLTSYSHHFGQCHWKHKTHDKMSFSLLSNDV